MTEWNECLHACGAKPCAPWLFGALEIQIESSVSQPIRSGSEDLMSGWVPYLMLNITTPPHPVIVLLLTNLLGYRGPTIVKSVPCLEPSPWVWYQGGSGQGLYCLVEVPPLLPSPYKSPEHSVTSGEAGWTAGSTHLCHALGTSQVWAHALLRAVDSNDIMRALGAHLDHPVSWPNQGVSRGMNP